MASCLLGLGNEEARKEKIELGHETSLCYYINVLTTRNINMNKDTAVKGYTDEMEMGEFLGDVYRGVSHIRVGIWCLVVLELAKFVLW